MLVGFSPCQTCSLGLFQRKECILPPSLQLSSLVLFSREIEKGLGVVILAFNRSTPEAGRCHEFKASLSQTFMELERQLSG